MFKTQFSSAVWRLLCFVALALCFGGVANAQTNAQVISIQAPAPQKEGNGGTGTTKFTFTLRLSRLATQRLTVSVDTGGTGQFPAFEQPRGFFAADYIGVHRDVTFDIGQDSVDVDVFVNGDGTYENDEQFLLFVSNPRYNGNTATGVTFANGQNAFGSDSAVTTILNDDDPPVLRFQTPAATLEGDATTDAQGNVVQERTVVPVTIDIVPPAERPLSVSFDTSDNGTQPGSMTGTATAGQDYVPITDNRVTIPAGVTQYTYPPPNSGNTGGPQGVVILGDNQYEGDEAFTLSVRYLPAILNTTPSSTVITIRDNDLPNYTLTGGRAFEGGSIPFVFTLTDINTGKPVAAKSAITVNYILDDVSATFGADYTNPGFDVRQGSFVVPIGDSQATINIPVLTDTIAETTEQFTFRITNVTGARNSTTNNTATGIIDNVNTNPVISIDNSSVIEGTGGVTNMVFTVSLSNSSTQQITVDYETTDDNTVPADQRATAGVDYSSSRGTITFPAVNGTPVTANTVQTFSIPITTDNINENNENFRVRLSNPSGGFAAFPNAAPQVFATGTIIDDDSAGTVSMDKTQDSVLENIAGGKINVIVNLVPTGTPARPVTVDFTTLPGTAMQAGRRDYFGKTGRVTFQPQAGNASVAIPIEIINDDIHEGDETFTVRLTAVDGATFDPNGSRDTVVTIIDDDPIPTVSVFPASPIREDGGVKNFVVAINGKSQAPVVVNYNIGNDGDTATAGLDYEAVDALKSPLNGQVMFTLGGPVSYFVPAKILEDDIAEGNETFSLLLSKDQNDLSFNLSPSGTKSVATIVDDDLTPSLKIGDASVPEGNTGNINNDDTAVLNFPVTLTRASSRPVTFTYSTLNLRQPDCKTSNGCDVASDDDYASVRNVVVTIPAGETTANIAVKVVPDTLNEYNEQFAVVARSLVNAVPLVIPVEPTPGNPNPNPRFGTVAFGTIVNDDPGGAITITGPFTDATGTTLVGNLSEGYKRDANNTVIGTTGNFRVTLPAPAGRPVTVTYTIEGSVTDSDVTDITTGAGKTGELKGQLTFFRGDTSRNIVLRASADNEPEPTETLRVVIAIDDRNGGNSYTVDPNAKSVETSILDRTPSIQSFAPATGFPAYGTVAASQVVINGKLLRTDGNPRVESVSFNGGIVGRGGIQYTSDNAITVSVPDNAKSGPITLTLTDGSTVLGFPNTAGGVAPKFLVQPVIQSIAPDTGVRGATVITITGRNFNDGNNAVTGVQFSGGANAFVPANGFEQVDPANRDTQIQVKVPNAAVDGPVSIVTANGAGPASQASFSVVSASTGGITFAGGNPDLNPILEGSTGSTSDITKTVRNFDGGTNSTLHRPYLLFVTPAQQTTGANSGQALPQTPITITIQVKSSTNSGRKPQILVRGDLTGAGRPTFIQSSGADGTVNVNIPASYNPANPLEIGIVDAGTDDQPPVVGATGAATVTVTAKVTASMDEAFFPITPNNQTQFVTVQRREAVTNTNQTVVAFAANSVNNFSVPFSTDNANSVAITDVFLNSQQAGNFAIYRFDASNQLNSRSTDGGDFVQLAPTDRLQRGVGYRIVTGSQEVLLKARDANLQTISANSYALNLTRNIPFAGSASNAANANNGYNFIGFPFNNIAFSGVNFNNTTVTVDGTTRSLGDAVAAGLINPQLYTLNADGSLQPVTGDPVIRPFKAYFVQIFRDNLTINLNSPAK